MPLTDYQILLRSRVDGSIKTIFTPQQTYSVKYARKLNEVAATTIELPGDDTTQALFLLDDFIEIERRSPVTGNFEVEGTYFMRYLQRLLTDDQDRLVVGGRSLEHLFKRRIIDPDDDPGSIGGYTIISGPADALMHYLTLYNLGSSASAARQIPDLILNPVGGVGAVIGDKLRHQNLLETLQDFSSRGAVDFKITRTSGRDLEVDITHIGRDLTYATNFGLTPLILLQPEKGNLIDPSLTLDRIDEITMVYALGQGPGDRRIVARVGNTQVAASPYNRIETSEDFRNIDRSTGQNLLTAGEAFLIDENRDMEEFDFKVDPQVPGTIYRQDWDIGDSVSVWWGEYKKDFRFVGIDVTLDDSGEEIEVDIREVTNA